jgi:hypothetical protein
MPFDGGYLANDPVVKALRDAQERIRVHGLARGSFRNSYGAYCALGAIYDVPSNLYRTSDWNIFWQSLKYYTGKHPAKQYLRRVVGMRIPKWNDRYATNKQQVIQKFDEAIEFRMAQMMCDY